MKAGERTRQQLLHSGDQYVIPVLQLYYTWGQGDWGRLWEDLEPHSTRLRAAVALPQIDRLRSEKHQPGTVPGTR
jgi:hypothetical protein